MKTLEERFQNFVAPCPISGCWFWMGQVSLNGYGSIRISGKLEGAHRVSYRLFKGQIPEGFDVDHLCKMKNCVNPDHLEAVTHQENTMRRGTSFSRDGVCLRCGKKAVKRKDAPNARRCPPCEKQKREASRG